MLAIALACAAPASALSLVATIAVGNSPAAVAFTPDGTRVYVTNSGAGASGNSVSIIDMASRTVTGTITGFSAPNGIAIAGSTAVVGGATVKKVSTTSNTIVGTTAAAAYGSQIAISSDGGYAYVASGLAVAKIDLATSTVAATSANLPGGMNYESVAIDSAGARVIATSYNEGRITSFNPATMATDTTVSPGFGLIGLAITPDGTGVYVARCSGSTVTRYNAITLAAVGSPIAGPGCPWGVGLNPSGTTAYVAGFSAGTVSVIDVPSGTVLDTVTVGASPKGIAVSPDGGTVVVANSGNNTVSVLAVAPSAPTGLSATAGDGAASVAFTPGASPQTITNYEYSLDGGAWTALSPAATSSPVTIPNLANGTAYSVRLRAVAGALAGDPSAPVSVTPVAIPPAAPTGLSATAGDGAATVAFTAGASSRTITNYEYSLDGGAWTALSPAATSSPVTIPDLANGTAYSVRLRAVAGALAGDPSAPVSVTPAAATSAATAASAAAGATDSTVRARTMIVAARVDGAGVVTMRVRTSGPGRVVMTATPAGGASGCRTSLRVAGAGAETMRCVLPAATLRLRAQRVVRMAVRATFTPSGGDATTAVRRISLGRLASPEPPAPVTG